MERRAEGWGVGGGPCQHTLSEDPRSRPRLLWGGHSAAGQRGLQLCRGGQQFALLGCGSHPSSFGPHCGVRAPPSSSPALPFLDHLLSELRQLAPPAIFGEPVITPWDPVEPLLRRGPSPYILSPHSVQRYDPFRCPHSPPLPSQRAPGATRVPVLSQRSIDI